MPAGREVASVLEILGLVVLLLVMVGVGAADTGDGYGDGGGDERWRTFVNNAILGCCVGVLMESVFFCQSFFDNSSMICPDLRLDYSLVVKCQTCPSIIVKKCQEMSKKCSEFGTLVLEINKINCMDIIQLFLKPKFLGNSFIL